MTDYNLGTARGVIEIEYRDGGVKKASQDVDSVGKQATKSSAGVGKFKKELLGLAGISTVAGIVGGFVLATKTVAQFEHQLSAIEAVSGATANQMDAIRGKALQLGADTAFSASEAASAMEELVKAGLTVDEVLGGAADAAVALAAAGGIDIPQAATIASNAMNQFGLNAAQLPGVVDDIAGAANASAIDVGQLGTSLSQVGAVANLAGLSFKDTATAIALMGNAGIVGSDAGTSLKTMLQNLQPQTQKQMGLMKELGIITDEGANRFFDAAGNVKSYAQLSQVLAEALKGQTNQQKLANLETIFGTDAIRAAAVSADAGARGVNSLNKEMSKMTAAEVAAKRMDNLSGSLDQLGGSIETALIVGASGGLDPLRALVDGLTDFINFAVEAGGLLAREVAPGFHDLFDAVSDVVKIGMDIIDVFDGVAGAIAGLALGAVIVLFNAVASVLSTVTSLLEDQGPAIAVVAGTWLLLANGGLAAVAARLGWLAAYGLVQTLNGLVALSGGAAAARASLTTLAGSAAAVAASLGAVVVLVGAVMAWNAYREAVEETTKALDDADKAMSSGDVSGIQDQIKSLDELTAARKKAIKEYDPGGLFALNANTFKNVAPWRWDDVMKVEEYKSSADEISSKSDELQDSLEQVGSRVADMAVQIGALDPSKATELMDALSEGDPDAIKQVETLMTQIEPLLARAGISATQFKEALGNSGEVTYGQVLTALDGVIDKTGRGTTSTQSLADAAKSFSNEALSAADSAKLLNSALDELIGVELDADEAAAKWREGLRNLRAEIGKTSGSIKEGTVVGDKNRATIRDNVRNILDQVSAEAKAGTSIQKIIGLYKGHRRELIQNAVDAGVNRKAMVDLLNSYNFTPASVRTLIQAVGAEQAQTKIQKLTEQYALTPDEVKTAFEAAGATTAKEKVKALLDYIKSLPGNTDSKVGVPGADKSSDQIQDLLNRIEKLKPKAAQIDTPGAVQAAEQIRNLREQIALLRDKDVHITTYQQVVNLIKNKPAGNVPSSLVPDKYQSPRNVGPISDVRGRTVDPEIGGAFQRIAAAQRTTIDDPASYGSPTGAGASSTGATGGLRLLSGSLSIDESGRAWIEGVVEDVVEGNSRFEDAYGRMG